MGVRDVLDHGQAVRWAMSRMGCMSQLTPPKWTVMIAPVRGVMAASMADGAML